MTEQPSLTEPDDESEPPDWREITIVADHDGEQRKHTFRVKLDLDYKDMVAVTRFTTKGGSEADMLPTVDRVLRRSMCDADGTPARWRPQVNEEQFVAPDGTVLPADRVDEFTGFEAGSSSRRWRALLVDDDVFIDPERLMDAWNGLMGGTAERPTRR